MVEQARSTGLDVRLASMEGPLPAGPWDLVISVLAVHHLTDSAKRNLFDRVRQEARSFVLGDVVLVKPQTVDLEPDVDLPAAAQQQAEWCRGAIRWATADFAVISADYRAAQSGGSDGGGTPAQ
jgi:tRNA (cmo5U34)-methyltransferase